MSTALERIDAWQAAHGAGRTVSLVDGLVDAVREDPGAGAGPACSRYGYGRRGELAWLVEPDGTRFTYGYGDDGRLRSVDRAGQVHATFRYDEAGRLVAAQGPGGPRTHVYDDTGRLVRTLRGDAGAFAYRYDPRGRVASARCGREETRFGYDQSGRVARLEQVVDGAAVTVAFDFDEAGRLARLRFPGWGVTVTYAWDERGRPRRLSWSRGGARADTLLARFAYRDDEPGGRLAQRVTGDGVQAQTWHDPVSGQPVRTLLRRGGGVVWEQATTYDHAGRAQREGDRTYRYDSLGRLTEAAEAPRRWRFTYDAVDDLVAEEGPSPLPEVVATDADERVRRVVTGGVERVYRYNRAGELVEVIDDGERRARLRYDHKGRLVVKATPHGTERYVYGPDDGLLAVADAAGAPRLVYLRLPTGLVGLLDFSHRPGGEAVFLHGDGRGNLVLAGGAGGALEGPCQADPFGLPLHAPARVAYLHRERPFHDDLGLYRIGCRWYAPALRRFLTPDSYTGAPDDERLVNPFVPAGAQRAARAQILGEWLKQPRMRNRHAYCANDPVNRFDPNGHWSFGGVLLSLIGAIWTLPNTLLGLALEVTCLLGEVVRWVVWLCSGGSVTWQTPGFDAATSGRLNAFALVFTGGWLGSFRSLLGVTFGNVFFVNRDWRSSREYQSLPAQVTPPAYAGTGVILARDDTLYEHELRHVNQYSWFGPFFHLGLPVFGVYEWDVILNGYRNAWTERDAREHAGL